MNDNLKGKILREKKVCKFVINVYKVISDFIICYDIRPDAAIELTDSTSNKYVSISID